MRLKPVLAFGGIAAAGPLLFLRSPRTIAFEDAASRAGIAFVLRNSATPEKRQIETMVSGGAVFDYDKDGRPDIYFVNGARQPALDKPDPSW